MTQVKNGDTVRVHYTGKLADGKIFDTSTDREPLEFTVGGGRVIPGFGQAVVGMSPGESKTVEIPMDQAYGPWRKEKVVAIDRASFPENIEPQVGQRLALRQQDGRRVPVMVTGVTEFSVRLDANHPLVGKDLIFEIEIVEIT
jgi:FKBP-type peptidyl-prolyl cis-trans isomerase 2